ncbi:hypothetical protein FIBSPDRAFT_883700 [Athelia psychrophila]|uniref:Uncharacterized protein n=1 Tax=Athelia psychrophila TaxID=1759441 RepID=A0A166TUF9_9AGAM|nr:hypothetical protein FIBSPDRAFT_883700 [Fibularhizoctonia sp. CBS 109695]
MSSIWARRNSKTETVKNKTAGRSLVLNRQAPEPRPDTINADDLEPRLQREISDSTSAQATPLVASYASAGISGINRTVTTWHLQNLTKMRRPATSIFSAKSLELQLVGELQEANKLANPDHFAALEHRRRPVPKAKHKIAMPARQWSPFHFNISSAVKIIIYRRRRLHKDALVAQDIGQGRDFMDRGRLSLQKKKNNRLKYRRHKV